MEQPAANILRIGGGNVYVGNRDRDRAVNTALSTFPHSWGWSEGAHLPSTLRGRDHYDALIAVGAEDGYDANDCVMQVRKTLDVVHFSMTRACEDVPGSKVGHQRQFSMIAYEAPMLGVGIRVCHIAIHPNWVAGFDSTGSAVVREYLNSMQVLRAMLAFAEAMGWVIVVTGDFNSHKGDDKSFETVYDVFKDARLRVKTDGLDGVAWDRRLVREEWHLIPKSATGSDHDNWVVADFRLRGKAA